MRTSAKYNEISGGFFSGERFKKPKNTQINFLSWGLKVLRSGFRLLNLVLDWHFWPLEHSLWPPAPKKCEIDWIGGKFRVFWNAHHWKIRPWSQTHLGEETLSSHCCRRGPRLDLSFQRKFQQNMKILCWGFHKMHKWKWLTEGPTLLILGFLVKIWSKIKFLVVLNQILPIGIKSDKILKFW